jgi:predicted nuclease of predicted toxin-antitoxin system
VKFLVDENLSPAVAKALVELGHDAVHVDELGAQGVPGDGIMALAAAQSRVIISADTDFGALLASTRATKPSVILVRTLITQRPSQLAATVAGHLDLIEAELLSGAIAAFGKDALRVRPLPLR